MTNKKNITEKEEDYNFSELLEDSELEYTPQEIVREYHNREQILKGMMADSLGLDHITKTYLQLIKLEKTEARKVLGKDNKEYFELL